VAGGRAATEEEHDERDAQTEDHQQLCARMTHNARTANESTTNKKAWQEANG
jgi:hypothetical protein